MCLLIGLLTSCSSKPAAQITATPSDRNFGERLTPTITMTEDIQDHPTSFSNDVESGCFRPYADKSVWNMPIDWSKTRIHPHNDEMLAAFFQDEKWIGSNTDKYTPNLYFVTSSANLVPVKVVNRFRDVINDESIDYGISGDINWMPIPPDAEPAIGTDSQLAIVNLQSGEEWGIIKGKIDAQGQWSAEGAYRYNVHLSGIPPLGFGQRGAGISQLAGLVRPCEVERGEINHAVTLAYDYPCAPDVCQLNGWPSAIEPFTKTDGLGVSLYDIPEGARMVIRPEISRAEIAQACANMKGCMVWALAMQKYGGFIVDDSDHPKTYAEGNPTAKWERGMWSADMLKPIPPEWYAVIDWGYTSTVP